MTARFDNSERRLRGRKLQATRLRLWTKANGCCEMCGKLTNWPDGFELDHTVPVHKGGTDKDSNLKVLCAPNGCHVQKTNKDMGLVVKQEIGADGWPT